MQSVCSCKEKPFADRACSLWRRIFLFDEVLGSISAALLSPVIDSPRQRLVVELKEMHNTGKVGSCGLICIYWLI